MAYKKDRITLYYYGDVGAFDLNSPSYVSNQLYCSEILYAIAANNPYSLNVNELSNHLEVGVDDLIRVLDDLLRIKMISEINGYYKLEFTCFLDSDIALIQRDLLGPAKSLASRIKTEVEVLKPLLSKLKNFESHSIERWLYHIICDSIFDGSAFDYLERKNLFRTHKPQMDQRNYIAYGFQDSLEMDQLSRKLLCSSNNFSVDGFTFNSFGDSDGSRIDFFRINKQTVSTSFNEFANPRVREIYRAFTEKHNREIGLKCAHLLKRMIKEQPLTTADFDTTEGLYLNYLCALGYAEITDSQVKCVVPVFDSEDAELILRISDWIMDLIYPEVLSCLNTFIVQRPTLTPLVHSIEVSEILIELWHQLFGQINEALIHLQVVSNPVYADGEGRFFKSFIMT